MADALLFAHLGDLVAEAASNPSFNLAAELAALVDALAADAEVAQ